MAEVLIDTIKISLSPSEAVLLSDTLRKAVGIENATGLLNEQQSKLAWDIACRLTYAVNTNKEKHLLYV